MKLNERLNVLIQSTALSQKSGNLTLDEAVRAKTAIDIISSGELNQNFAEAINVLIELAVLSQKKGVFSLKDAYMIYLAIEGIENEFRYEVSKLSSVTPTPSSSSVVRKEVELTETANDLLKKGLKIALKSEKEIFSQEILKIQDEIDKALE